MSRESVLCVAQKDLSGNLLAPRQLKMKRKGGNFYMQNRNVALSLATDDDLSKLDYKVFLFLLGNLEYDNNVNATQAGLAEALCMPHSAISKTIKNLTKKGMITQRKTLGVKQFHVEECYATRKRSTE